MSGYACSNFSDITVANPPSSQSPFVLGPSCRTLSPLGPSCRSLSTLRESIRKEVVNQRPDGIVVDAISRRIHVIEVARTEDSTDQLRRVFVWKNTKYIQLIQQRRALFPDFRTEQLTFFIWICERHNRRHLHSMENRAQVTKTSVVIRQSGKKGNGKRNGL